jgi:Protein of unknown function (DUF4231)
MDAETNRQLAFIVDELEKSLEFFRRKRNYSRIVTSLFIAGGASLSAIATVALGASRMTQVTWLAVVALVASGLATVVVALEALFEHRRLWSIDNAALAELEKLKRDLEYRRADAKPIQQAEVDQLYGRLSQTLDDANRSWISVHASK